MLPRLAAHCYKHRWRVLILWVVALVGVNVLAQSVGGDLLKTFDVPGSESGKAFAVLERDFARTGDTGYLVFKVTDPQDVVGGTNIRPTIETLMDELRKQPHVVSVDSPYDPAKSRFVSGDERIAYAEINFDVQANDVPIEVANDMRGIVAKADADSDRLQIELAGTMFVDQTQPASELIGIAAAILILLLAFGSLLAMGLPIMTAMFGIGIGLAVVTLLARVLDIPSFAPQVTAMIGIGVGIDYALFISTRYREALHEGADPQRAVVHAIDTSGRAVLFAGGTVVISLLGLFVIGVSFIRGLAIGASLAVLFVMAAAITLLPAVLGFVGHTIDRWALPGAKKKRSTEGSFWTRWSQTVQRRPWAAAIGGLLILLILAVPFFSMRLGIADSGNDPTKMTTRRSYDLLSQGFGPGFNGPLLVAGEATASDLATVQKLRDTIADDPDVVQVSPVIPGPKGSGALIQVVPKGSPQDASTTALVHRLRDETIPAATAGTGLEMFVGSQTAVGVDLADLQGARLPWMFVSILFLSFILLMVVFRSLLVPLKAVIMNLLSIGAAYGVIVAIFQWGWVKNFVGIGKEGPIEAWIPMMLFAIVFGLSMDYEVFLLSRIKEEYDEHGDNSLAVAHGLAKTARLITAAAAIMICVFGSFVLSDLRVLKLIGFGLAFAVLIDATLVRLILVPATMELLGDRNWWLPKWLEWLPRVNVEGDPDFVAAPEAAREPEPALGS